MSKRYADLDNYPGETSMYGHARVYRDSDNDHDPGVDCESADDGKTRQEFRDESDINFLMKRYENTGIPPWKDGAPPPQYLDVSVVPDFQSAMNAVIDAENAFMSLPATVRKEFDNDPVRFVEFASEVNEDGSSKNIAELRKWGLAPPPEPVKAPLDVRVVPDPDLDAKPS